MIRYESNRGHNIDGTEPDQNETTAGEKSWESRREESAKTAASKGHRRQEGTQKREKTEVNKQETKTETEAKTEETNKRHSHNTRSPRKTFWLNRLYNKDSPPIGSGVQPRQEDKGRDITNEYDTQRTNTGRWAEYDKFTVYSATNSGYGLTS